ncbi:MAG: DUF2490 domain-containing protein [Bacteroidales bacterium]|nr:DUF2490 domain-containing protein [Bacteroidales bacterium]
MRKRSILYIALVLAPLAAAAQSSVGGAWGSLQIGTTWGDGWYANLRNEYRMRDGSTDVWFIRPTIGKRLTPWLKADIGFDRFETPSAVQWRGLLSLTFILKQGPLTASLRERYIRSYTPDTDTWGNLLRSQLKVAYAVPGTVLKPYVAIEIYAWEHWRQTHHFVGCQLTVAKGHNIDFFYVYATSATKPEAHIAGIGYELTL